MVYVNRKYEDIFYKLYDSKLIPFRINRLHAIYHLYITRTN